MDIKIDRLMDFLGASKVHRHRSHDR